MNVRGPLFSAYDQASTGCSLGSSGRALLWTQRLPSTLLYAGGRKLLGDVVFERHYPPFDSAAPNAAPAAAVRVA